MIDSMLLEVMKFLHICCDSYEASIQTNHKSLIQSNQDNAVLVKHPHYNRIKFILKVVYKIKLDELKTLETQQNYFESFLTIDDDLSAASKTQLNC
ncbi:CLUMA_CG005893, isoform A [Clunio marinus]|uniref:CLUMA_CG005893, isoform A n=1 Tax=Clunio marinus TaxID=568069 RepID=A0A1J1HXP2_9DIPT|nr:CLUMA_CG005893, isoform A [Clunio marinus]